MKKASVLATTLLTLALLASGAHAQFLGYVSDQSTTQIVFTAQAANGASSTFNNIGQSAHLLLYCNSSFSGTISLEASPDGTFSTPIGMAAANWGQNSVTDSQCHVLQAGGYYQTVRARITNYVAGSVNAWYTSVGGPIAPIPAAMNSNGPASPVQCDQSTFLGLAPSTGNTQVIAVGPTGQSIYVCGGTFSLATGTPTDGSVQLLWGTGSTCTSSTNLFLAKIEANTPQIFPLNVSFKVPTGKTLCMLTQANGVTVFLSLAYAMF
jgi:hypothetical protein